MADETTAEATRRQFFRLLGRQTAAGAGQLIGTVNALRQSSAAAANELLGVAPDEATEPRGAGGAVSGGAATGTEFRSPYRYVEGALLILDQRALPDRMVTLECHEPSEVAAAIRAGAAGGGPVLGQLAAHAAALVVARLTTDSTHRRRSALAAATGTLRAARPSQHAIRHALGRIEAADRALPDDVDGGDHGRVLFAEAEAIALSAAVAHGRLASAGAELLASRQPEPTRPISMLVHGDGGPLAGGLVGTSLAIATTLAAAGHRLHVWLTECSPTLEGVRLAAAHLAASDVAHTIVADTAVSWLFDHRRVDTVLLRGDRICANGDCVAPLGSLNVARLAQPRGVAVLACAPATSLDLETPAGTRIPPEFRPPAEGARGPRLDPVADVVPAGLLTGLLTEAGLVEPPYESALAELVATAAAARGATTSVSG